MTRLTRALRALPLALVTALALSVPAVSEEAAGPVYNVEIIVFRALTAQGGTENWSEQSGARIIGEESTTSGSLQVGRFVGLLPAAGYQLNELESRLRASGVWLPVAHAAWSQTASAWGTRAGFALNRLGIDVPGLSGNVYLEHGQFLHLGMSLNWAMENPPDGLGAGPGTAFTLNETRRVRFYERNYYDHPAFGVIALVTPAQGPRAVGR